MTHHVTSLAAAPDWHPADIVAALRKRGVSLRELARRHGRHPTVVRKALDRPLPLYQGWIADAIGVPPATIWPSRYQGRDHEARRTRRARNKKTSPQ